MCGKYCFGKGGRGVPHDKVTFEQEKSHKALLRKNSREKKQAAQRP